MRLGHKMEGVFAAVMKGQDRYRLIDRNIVVKRDKTTLGEIDFLFRDTAEKRLLHLELTYKFYLVDTEISAPVYRLVGPNRKDMFYTKLDKLKDNQLPLPFTPEGIAALKDHIPEIEELRQQVCFKAQLFRPYSESAVRIRPLNKNCITGFWLRFDDFQTRHFKPYTYLFPSKEEWVLNPYEKGGWMSYHEVLLELNLRMIKQNSTMVWMKKGEGVFEKFFAVWW